MHIKDANIYISSPLPLRLFFIFPKICFQVNFNKLVLLFLNYNYVNYKII